MILQQLKVINICKYLKMDYFNTGKLNVYSSLLNFIKNKLKLYVYNNKNTALGRIQRITKNFVIRTTGIQVSRLWIYNHISITIMYFYNVGVMKIFFER